MQIFENLRNIPNEYKLPFKNHMCKLNQNVTEAVEGLHVSPIILSLVPKGTLAISHQP